MIDILNIKKGDNVGQNITPKLKLRKYFYNQIEKLITESYANRSLAATAINFFTRLGSVKRVFSRL
ncbi:hypothetical protein, partial [Acinetobacter baumannii]|uniref:hypothetical protein n=1 Tax=Acinetobacter baumannii TaxID=470 RepID=UPI001BB2D5FF